MRGRTLSRAHTYTHTHTNAQRHAGDKGEEGGDEGKGVKRSTRKRKVGSGGGGLGE